MFILGGGGILGLIIYSPLQIYDLYYLKTFLLERITVDIPLINVCTMPAVVTVTGVTVIAEPTVRELSTITIILFW